MEGSRRVSDYVTPVEFMQNGERRITRQISEDPVLDPYNPDSTGTPSVLSGLNRHLELLEELVAKQDLFVGGLTFLSQAMKDMMSRNFDELLETRKVSICYISNRGCGKGADVGLSDRPMI